MVMDRRKRLLSYAEYHAKKILEDAVRKQRASVAYKIRLRDALKIESSGLEEQFYDYATKAHFDFVVQDHRGFALFAIEWDGPHHNRPERAAKDQCKNFICDELNFPLFRINCTGLRLPSYHRVLRTIADCWFDPAVEYEPINALDEIYKLDTELMAYGSERASGLTAHEALCFYVAQEADSVEGVKEASLGRHNISLVTEELGPCAAASQLHARVHNKELVLASGSCKVPVLRAHAATWLSEIICIENTRSRIFEFM